MGQVYVHNKAFFVLFFSFSWLGFDISVGWLFCNLHLFIPWDPEVFPSYLASCRRFFRMLTSQNRPNNESLFNDIDVYLRSLKDLTVITSILHQEGLLTLDQPDRILIVLLRLIRDVQTDH